MYRPGPLQPTQSAAAHKSSFPFYLKFISVLLQGFLLSSPPGFSGLVALLNRPNTHMQEVNHQGFTRGARLTQTGMV